jgi:hypothetical protein
VIHSQMYTLVPPKSQYSCTRLNVTLSHLVTGPFFCSSYSLGFAQSTRSRSARPDVQSRVQERLRQLKDLYEATRCSKTQGVPLISEEPRATVAILICKVLVPKGTKCCYIPPKGLKGSSTQYSTMVSSQVCPRFLVHIAEGTLPVPRH